VETLHHEWGHALHSLLSRTTFQHLSGTRGGVDFVEVPSHLFEHFSRTPSVVCQWAKHYMTGQQLPREHIEEALRAKGAFEGIDTQTQIIYSAADQVYAVHSSLLLNYFYDAFFYKLTMWLL
jgi:mitochondrial intermediate peptidase